MSAFKLREHPAYPALPERLHLPAHSSGSLGGLASGCVAGGWAPDGQRFDRLPAGWWPAPVPAGGRAQPPESCRASSTGGDSARIIKGLVLWPKSWSHRGQSRPFAVASRLSANADRAASIRPCRPIESMESVGGHQRSLTLRRLQFRHGGRWFDCRYARFSGRTALGAPMTGH